MIAGKTSAYCTADPLTQTLLDNELITANNKAGSVISYVYTDHHEFRQNNDKDLPSDFFSSSQKYDLIYCSKKYFSFLVGSMHCH